MKNERMLYNGYLKAGNYEERIILNEENNYVFEVEAEHLYTIHKDLKVYDKNGNYIKTIQEETHQRKKEKREVKNNFTVVQIDYKFYLLPIGRCVTQEEVKDACLCLNNGCFSGFQSDYSKTEQMIYFMNGSTSTSYYNLRELHKFFKRPIEIACYGKSIWLYRKPIKKFINLDFLEYRKEKNNFLKKHPHYKKEIEDIYLLNKLAISYFYMTSVNKIFRKDFKKLGCMIDRLNFNINLKTIEL